MISTAKKIDVDIHFETEFHYNLDMSRVLSYFKSLVTMTILTHADFQENCLTSSGTRSFGRKLPVRPWKVLQDIGLQSCLRECEKQTACKSINYNLIFYGCEFLDTKTNDSTRFEQNANYVYGEIYNEVSSQTA